MQFSREPIQSVTVRQVEPGRIDIGRLREGNQSYEQTVALTADEVLTDVDCVDIDGLALDHLTPLLQRQPDVIIVGTGWSPVLAPRELTFALARQGIGLEVMDTPAACRTFNILVAEDRRPGALLFLR